MDQQLPSVVNTQILKRNGLLFLVIAITLLLIVVFLLASGRIPIVLILLTVVSGGYGLRNLWLASRH